MGTDGKNSDEAGAFSHPDPVVDEALDWLARQQNAVLDPETQREFETWLQRSPRHVQEFNYLSAMWELPSLGKAAAATGLHQAEIAVRIKQSQRWLRGAMAAAAVVLLTIGAWHYPSAKLRWNADYLTVAGQREQIILPDGSTMLLNTASAVSIDFRDGRRRVRLLQGEAYFDVKHDPAHPFMVSAHFGETEVKGTAFSVRANDVEDIVMLERGRVQVSRLSAPQERVDLVPGDTVTATATELLPVAKQDLADALAWRNGRIVFNNQPLSRVLSELRRYYNGTVVVLDKSAGDLIVTGNYRVDDVPGAIRTLADTAGISMTQIPGGFIVLR